MRLTLRTMLAYMDNILDPKDAEELRARIENSELAGTLMRRIESATHRIRLESPALDAKGMGADANTVAEYLDNTLPPERVPEFERVCLESDMHLAEVAACHQVLAQVLGRRVEIRPELRRRVHAIGQTGPASRTGELAAAAGDTQSAAESAEGVRTKGGKIWRADRSGPPAVFGRRRSTPWLLAVVIVVLLTAAAVVIFGPWPPRMALGPAREGLREQRLDVPVERDDARQADSEGTGASRDTHDESASSGQQSPAVARDQQDSDPVRPTDASSTGNGTAGRADTDRGSPDRGTAVDRGDAAEPGDEDSLPPTFADTQDAAAADSGDVDEATPELPTIQNPLTLRGQPAGESSGLSVDSLLPDTDRAEWIVTTSDQVALVMTEPGQWQPVSVSDRLTPASAVVSLPAFRPQVELDDSLVITSSRAAWQPVDPVDGNALAGINVDYGRFLFENKSPTPTYLQVHWADRWATLRLSANGGAAALEIMPVRLPGDDPLTVPPHQVLKLVVLEGVVQWDGGNGETRDLPASSGLGVVDNADPEPLERATAPEWVDLRNVKPILRQEAAPVLREAVQTEGSAATALQSLLGHRRVELRALAAMSLVQLDQFDGALASLNDPDQHWAWSELFDSLQAAIARGPATARKLQEACQRVYPASADQVYALLVGYGPSMLRTGGAEQLVDQLSSSQLPVRVLALENLRRITGGKTLRYRPEANERQRERAMAAWSRRLAQGEIVYQQQPQIPESLLR